MSVAGYSQDLSELRASVHHDGRGRSTVSRWFAGKPTSLPVALRIVGKLGLRFDDVYSRCEVEPEG